MKPFLKIIRVKPNDQANIQYKPHWDFYLSNVGNKLCSIFLDLGLEVIAPVADQNFLYSISIKMNNPEDDGLASVEEYDKLQQMEDEIIKAIKARHGGTYVGRLTMDNYRNTFIYLSDPTLVDKTISDVMVKYPFYDYDYHHEKDEAWTQYFKVLYPKPEQLQSMMNSRVVQLMKQQGDNLVDERPVDHFVYFSNAADRDRFSEQIVRDGFEIIGTSEDNSYERPYGIQINRIDKVDQVSLDECVLHVKRLAEDMNGHYDGWGTPMSLD